jgi:Sensors of blue-light using FAD
MDSLIHIIYASAEERVFGESELTEVLLRARQANAQLGVTGILIYAEGSFFQVLEGKVEDVEAVFTKILSDPRHRDIVQIIREPIHGRDFGDWTMGFLTMTRQDIESIEGMNDFFGAQSCLTQMDSGRAQKLLLSFRRGRWRSSHNSPQGVAPTN